ncbi:hypothetical protein SNE40_006506 [Patella caerulea]|uniref:Replication protein A subunit n=1 Tax=Patella caerulea TaxID=87958 RepID=A0AAN8PW14_PATCE
MAAKLSNGSIEAIIQGGSPDKPVLQVISFKKISAGGSADRYRLLLSDGELTYSHAMLATQLNNYMEDGLIDNLCVIQVERYLCNTIQNDRRIMILLDVNVLQPGSQVGVRIGNPQQYKAGSTDGGQVNGHENTNNSNHMQTDTTPQQIIKPQNNSNGPMSTNNNKPGYSIKGGGAATASPSTTRVHSIASLTPYQNRWRIRARITQKSSVKTWSNSRGEGKLFSVNFLDESGEIRATGFNDAVDKFYDMLEVNKVYYVSRATLKTANKQYSSVNNDYEMTFNPDTNIEICEEETDLPTMTFDFVQISDLEKHQPNSMIDIIGVVSKCGDIGSVVGRQSQKEITKRDITLVDQSGVGVNLTLWGNDAQQFSGDGNPVIAVKGARLSDYGGRSLSVLASSQMIMNPDIRESHFLRGWYDREGQCMNFDKFASDGAGSSGAGGATNWKTFSQVKSENLGQSGKADFFTSKATIVYLKKENCMYQACPTDQCNKKVVDQGNGLYRCEKCNKEFPNFKWRMILSTNLADFSDNQWATCFQESAEMLLGEKADVIGNLREQDETKFDSLFQNALFKSFIFKLRAKVETYNEENRLKTVCLSATPVDWVQYGEHLVKEINQLVG